MGIGFAAAKAFLGQDAERLETAKRELGGGVAGFQVGLRKVSEIGGLATYVANAFGTVDVLFANAGVARFAPLASVDDDHFDSQFDVNVKGLFFTVQKLVPVIAPASSVILNATFGTIKGIANGSVYFATKAAVRSLARTFAVELGPRGVRVNALSPGLVPTPLFAKTAYGRPTAGPRRFLHGSSADRRA